MKLTVLIALTATVLAKRGNEGGGSRDGVWGNEKGEDCYKQEDGTEICKPNRDGRRADKGEFFGDMDMEGMSGA